MRLKNMQTGRLLISLAASLTLLISIPAAATTPSKANAEMQQVSKAMSDLLADGRQVDSISASPVPGVYEVVVGAKIFYVSGDGKYIFLGKLFDVDKRQDLSTAKVANIKAKMIEDFGEKDMVIFSPESYQHTVTVFTDIDCGYCRKLHAEIQQYNDLGIRVRYMMFPRAGVGSPSFQKAVNVLCADDRNNAMTRAKAGEEIETKKCKNAVEQEYNLGMELGVTGTPAIFLENGELLPGYIPAKRMSAILNEVGN